MDDYMRTIRVPIIMRDGRATSLEITSVWTFEPSGARPAAVTHSFPEYVIDKALAQDDKRVGRHAAPFKPPQDGPPPHQDRHIKVLDFAWTAIGSRTARGPIWTLVEI